MSISLINHNWATAPICSSTSIGGRFLGGSTNSSIITVSLWYFGDLSFSNSLFLTTPAGQGAGIITYNTSGTPLWIAKFDSTGDDNNIQTSMNNTHVFSIGSFQANTLTISDIIISGNSSYTSAFITAYSVNGLLLSAKSITATDAVRGYTIKVYNNIVYVGGFYNSALVIDSKTLPGPTGQGGFIAAFNYNTSFDCLWLNSIDSTGSDIATTITATNNRVFVGGTFNGTLTIGSYTITSITGGAYIAAYNLLGQIQNLIKIDTIGLDNLFGLDSSNGRVYSAGLYNGSLTIGSYTLSTPVGSAVYVACFDTSLNILWLNSIDSNDKEFIGFNTLTANSNFCFVHMSYTSTITIGTFSFAAPLSGRGTLTVCYDKYGNVVDVKSIDSSDIDDSNCIFATDNNLYSTIAYTTPPTISGTLLPNPLPTAPPTRQLPLLMNYSIAKPINETPILSAQSIYAGISLLWNSVSGATDYRIYYGLSGSGFTNYTPNISGTSYTLTSLIPGSTYQIAIVTLFYGNESPYSNTIFRTPLSLTPATFNITSGVQNVNLNWSSVTGATGYRIYYGLSGASFSLFQDFINVTDGIISGLTSGLTYKFYIVSYNNGGESTPPSTILTAIPRSSPPTSFTATATNLAVLLSWNAVEGAAYYKIYYGTFESYNLSGIVYGLNTTISGLNAGTSYNFKISSINDGGESPLSSSIYSIPLPMPPNTPTGLTVTSGILLVDLSWNTVSGATGYKITYGLYDILDNDILVGNINSYRITNLLPDLSYGFVISASNLGGFSPISTPAKYAITAPPIPLIPIDFSGSTDVKSVNLVWSDTAYTYEYIIKYSVSGSIVENYVVLVYGTTNTVISNLSGETVYQFAIASRNRTGESAFSPYIYISPWTVRPIQKPFFIEPLAFKSQIRLKISDIYNATYFVIYYGLEGQFTNQITILRSQLIANNSIINVQFLKENTSYNFSIIAFNDETLSPESDILIIKTLETTIVTGGDASFVTMVNDSNTIYQFQQQQQQQQQNINQFKPTAAVDRLKYIQGLVRDSFISK